MIAAIIRIILTTSSQVGISEKASLLNTDIGAVMGIIVRMVLTTWSELTPLIRSMSTLEIGCRYAIIAKVSIDAAVRVISIGLFTNFSTI